MTKLLYSVNGPRKVFGKEPGSNVWLDLTLEQETRLVGRYLSRVAADDAIPDAAAPEVGPEPNPE